MWRGEKGRASGIRRNCALNGKSNAKKINEKRKRLNRQVEIFIEF